MWTDPEDRTKRAHERLAAILLLIAGARSLLLFVQAPPTPLLDPERGLPTELPDPATADRVRLSWLPGVGRHRAARMLVERPHLGVRLHPSKLELLPGFGPDLAEKIEAWYARDGWDRWTPQAAREPPWGR